MKKTLLTTSLALVAAMNSYAYEVTAVADGDAGLDATFDGTAGQNMSNALNTAADRFNSSAFQMEFADATTYYGTLVLDTGGKTFGSTANNTNFTLAHDLELNGGKLRLIEIKSVTVLGNINVVADSNIHSVDQNATITAASISGAFDVAMHINNTDKTQTYSIADYTGFTGTFNIDTQAKDALLTVTFGGAGATNSANTFGINVVDAGVNNDPQGRLNVTTLTAGSLTIAGDVIAAGTYTYADLITLGGAGYSEFLVDGGGSITIVPEPGTYALIGGLCALGFVMVRRRRS